MVSSLIIVGIGRRKLRKESWPIFGKLASNMVAKGAYYEHQIKDR